MLAFATSRRCRRHLLHALALVCLTAPAAGVLALPAYMGHVRRGNLARARALSPLSPLNPPPRALITARTFLLNKNQEISEKSSDVVVEPLRHFLDAPSLEKLNTTNSPSLNPGIRAPGASKVAFTCAGFLLVIPFLLTPNLVSGSRRLNVEGDRCLDLVWRLGG
jgi:hypothetical protein